MDSSGIPLSRRRIPQSRRDELDAILKKHTIQKGSEDVKDKLLGATFVVVDKDGLIFKGASGCLSLHAISKLWRSTTPVWAASMTKLITSIAILQLVDNKTIENTDPPQDIAAKHFTYTLGAQPILERFDESGLAVFQERRQPITLASLLTHTSGIGYDFLSDLIKQWNVGRGSLASCNDWSAEGFANPLLFQPRKGWAYGAGLDWAGFLLEIVTNQSNQSNQPNQPYQSLSDYIQKNIFDKVGMPDATFYPDKMPKRDKGPTYEDRMPQVVQRREDGSLEMTVTMRPPRQHEVVSGGAGLYCTALDYAALLHAILKDDVLFEDSHRGVLYDPLLSPQQAKMMEEMLPQIFGEHFKGIYDLGEGGCNHSLAGMVAMKPRPGGKRARSIMWAGARDSHWWIDPETGIGAVLMTSIERLGDRITAKLYKELELVLYRGLGNLGEPEQGAQP